jgi:hypothetical protein
VQGSDNVIAGAGGSVTGDKNAYFALCSSPSPLVADRTFKVCADEIILDAPLISDRLWGGSSSGDYATKTGVETLTNKTLTTAGADRDVKLGRSARAIDRRANQGIADDSDHAVGGAWRWEDDRSARLLPRDEGDSELYEHQRPTRHSLAAALSAAATRRRAISATTIRDPGDQSVHAVLRVRLGQKRYRLPAAYWDDRGARHGWGLTGDFNGTSDTNQGRLRYVDNGGSGNLTGGNAYKHAHGSRLLRDRRHAMTDPLVLNGPMPSEEYARYAAYWTSRIRACFVFVTGDSAGRPASASGCSWSNRCCRSCATCAWRLNDRPD